MKTKKKMNEMLAANTGKTVEEVARATERDYYLSADEALEFGLIDKIIQTKGTWYIFGF